MSEELKNPYPQWETIKNQNSLALKSYSILVVKFDTCVPPPFCRRCCLSFAFIVCLLSTLTPFSEIFHKTERAHCQLSASDLECFNAQERAASRIAINDAHPESTEMGFIDLIICKLSVSSAHCVGMLEVKVDLKQGCQTLVTQQGQN